MNRVLVFIFGILILFTYRMARPQIQAYVLDSLLIEAIDVATAENLEENEINDLLLNQAAFGLPRKGLFRLACGRVIESQKGYVGESAYYPGTPMYSKMQTKITASTWSLALLAENDPGESRVPFSDFQSAGLGLKPLGERLHLVVGDYQYDFGLGCLFASSRRFVSTLSDPIRLVYRASGLKTNTRMHEDQFLRGCGITLRTGSWSLSGISSFRQIDAIVNKGVLESFRGNGYHRTLTELDREKILYEQIEGLFAGQETDDRHWGIGLVEMRYPMKRFLRWGGYVKHRIHGAIIFAEVVGCSEKQFGGIYGLSYYGIEKQQFTAKVLLGSSKFFQRMTGIARTDQLHLNRRRIDVMYQRSLPHQWQFQMSLVHDRPWNRLDVVQPTKDLPVITLGVQKSKYDHYRFNAKTRLTSNGMMTTMRYAHFFEKTVKQVLGFGLVMSPEIVLQSARGFYVSWDGSWMFWNKRLSAKIGVLVHDVEEGLPALYGYEPGLQFDLRINRLSGIGFRTYTCLSMKMNASLLIECKFAHHARHDQNYYGSGWEEIDQGQKSRFQLQLIYRPNFKTIKVLGLTQGN